MFTYNFPFNEHDYFRPRLSTFGPRQDGAIDQDGFRADDETDSEEGTSSHPKLSNVDVLGNYFEIRESMYSKVISIFA